MLQDRTPFRQLARLYSIAISAPSQISGMREDLSKVRDEIKHQTDLENTLAGRLERDVQKVSITVQELDLHLNASKTAGHTHQDIATMQADLRQKIGQAMPDNPVIKGWNTYSQCDEDGIIRECLRRIETLVPLSKTFIEVGCGDGLENNTHQLLLDGFKGSWLDGSHTNISRIKEALGSLRTSQLFVKESFATLDSMGALIHEFRDFAGTTDIDFYTFDTDGNDLLLVRKSLETIKPKLLCVEYNGKFPPPTALTMAYNNTHMWSGDDYYGATLQAWVNELKDRYTLVSCNLTGVNAFFVRNDLASVFTIFSTEQLYQPTRYWLVGTNGHKASMRWLKQLNTANSSAPE
ncbi:hypothetical protein [Variovorax sp. EL159]|uniref:hypothetical protein n=1 Tax=Variovorax sp. EL159 TaxID=1566270 RepID=UPI0008909431|nr:hypothetical protein [Variovorax sp. EL159]SCX72649.1 hypothetical protein SAMN03159363_4373 [Variovorax sp. EL159]